MYAAATPAPSTIAATVRANDLDLRPGWDSHSEYNTGIGLNINVMGRCVKHNRPYDRASPGIASRSPRFSRTAK
jgi:hypothetical protein